MILPSSVLKVLELKFHFFIMVVTDCGISFFLYEGRLKERLAF